MVGCLVWMRLTDFWGRKWLIVTGAIMNILIFLLLLIKMNSVTLYINQFLFGFDSPLILSLTYLLLIEIVTPSRRALYSMIMNLADGFTSITLALFYKYGKNWWILFWINIGFTGFGLFMLLIWVKESPKFYVSLRKFDKAKEIYTHIAKINQRAMFSNKLQGEDRDESEANVLKEHGILELLKHKILRIQAIIIGFLWFSVSYISYGILLSLGKLEGSIYVNGYVSGASILVAQCVTGLVADGMGRKNGLIFCFLLSGVACLLYTPSQSLGSAPTYICLLLGKFGTSCAFTLVYLYTTQAMPTVYRGTVFGFSNICARLGGISAPLINSVAQGSFMYIFGGLGAASGLLSFLLKQTKGKLMADRADQTEAENGKLKFSQTNLSSQPYVSWQQNLVIKSNSAQMKK